MKVTKFEMTPNADTIDIESIMNVCNNKKSIDEWAYILHDKDDTRPHYHIAIKLIGSYDSKYFVDWFGIPENFFEKIKGRWEDILLYLTHKNAPDKFQYDNSDVIASFDYSKALDNIASGSRKTQIINSIVDGDIREYNYFSFISPIEYDKYKKNIDNAFKYRVDIMKGEDRLMECIFLRGDSGVGKTTYAKEIAKDKGFSVYVSSGSNDVLDDYKGQDCIILDDLRPSVMGLSDLLKMLDNHTTSTVKSRYKNKVLECKLIIITTVLDIDTFFSNVFSEEIETCIQLKRRCKTYINMFVDKIEISIWQELSRKYSVPVFARNPVSEMFVSSDRSIEDIKDFVSDFLGVELISSESDDLELVEQEKFPFK